MSLVTIRFAHGMTIVPPRARQSRRVELADALDVEVPDVAAADAPLAVRVVRPRDEYVRRAHDGGLYAPATGGNEGSPVERMAEPYFVAAVLFGDRPCPWDRNAFSFELSDVPEGAKVLADERDATRALIRERAGSLLMIDGGLWVRVREPVLCLEFSLAQAALTKIRDRPDVRSDPGFVFGLDRGAAFEAFAAQAARAGLKSRDGNGQPHEVALFAPGAARMDEDVENAATALRYAVRAGGSEIDALPVEAVVLMARAKGVAAALDAGTAIPDDADRILAALSGHVGPATPRLAMALGVGRAAIAASMPSPRGAARSDALEADAEDLAALTP